MQQRHHFTLIVIDACMMHDKRLGSDPSLPHTIFLCVKRYVQIHELRLFFYDMETHYEKQNKKYKFYLI